MGDLPVGGQAHGLRLGRFLSWRRPVVVGRRGAEQVTGRLVAAARLKISGGQAWVPPTLIGSSAPDGGPPEDLDQAARSGRQAPPVSHRWILNCARSPRVEQERSTRRARSSDGRPIPASGRARVKAASLRTDRAARARSDRTIRFREDPDHGLEVGWRVRTLSPVPVGFETRLSGAPGWRRKDGWQLAWGVASHRRRAGARAVGPRRQSYRRLTTPSPHGFDRRSRPRRRF
jgi:hypothetical protein